MARQHPAWFAQLRWSPVYGVGAIENSNVPVAPGCYVFTGYLSGLVPDDVLYVGRAVNLRRRLRGYLTDYTNIKKTEHTGKAFIYEYRHVHGDDNTYVRWTIYGGDLDQFESNLIWHLNPECNSRYERGPLWEDNELIESRFLG